MEDDIKNPQGFDIIISLENQELLKKIGAVLECNLSENDVVGIVTMSGTVFILRNPVYRTRLMHTDTDSPKEVHTIAPSKLESFPNKGSQVLLAAKEAIYSHGDET